MALENFVTNPGAGGETFASDNVGGVQYPVSKISLAPDGQGDQLLSALNPLPVALAASQLTSTVPDNTSPGQPVRLIGEDITTAGFVDVGSGILSPQMVQSGTTGAGQGINQSAGSLVLTAGTTAGSSTLLRSVTSWRGAWNLNARITISQRIANNNFAVILGDLIGENLPVLVNSSTSISVTKAAHGFTAQNVGQSVFVGACPLTGALDGRYAIASIPDANTINLTVSGWPASGTSTCTLFGRHHVKVLYNGTTVTAATYNTQRGGWQNTDATLAVNTTTVGHIINVHQSGRQNYVSDTVSATSTTPNVTLRGSFMENIPDDNTDLYVFLWMYNGSGAPASGTTWTIGFWSMEKFANTPVYIQGVRPQGAQPALPVAFQATPTVSVGSLPATPAGTNYTGRTAEPALNKTDRSISVSTTSAQCAAANATRTKMVFQNQDASINVFINVGAAATAGQGSIRIAPGATYELYGTTQAVNIIAASGTPAVTIWEF